MEYVDKLKSLIVVLAICLTVSILVNLHQSSFKKRQWKLIKEQSKFIDELMKDVKPNPTSYKRHSII